MPSRVFQRRSVIRAYPVLHVLFRPFSSKEKGQMAKHPAPQLEAPNSTPKSHANTQSREGKTLGVFAPLRDANERSGEVRCRATRPGLRSGRRHGYELSFCCSLDPKLSVRCTQTEEHRAIERPYFGQVQGKGLHALLLLFNLTKTLFPCQC
jgi:hypothetical protein